MYDPGFSPLLQEKFGRMRAFACVGVHVNKDDNLPLLGAKCSHQYPLHSAVVRQDRGVERGLLSNHFRHACA